MRATLHTLVQYCINFCELEVPLRKHFVQQCFTYSVNLALDCMNGVQQQEDKLSVILKALVGRGLWSGGFVWLPTLTSDIKRQFTAPTGVTKTPATEKQQYDWYL